MKVNGAAFIAAVLVVAAFLVGRGTAGGQQPPSTPLVPAFKTLGTIDLGPVIETMQGYELVLNLGTRAPDAAGYAPTLHSHKGAPIIAYVLQGVFTDHREGGVVQEFHVGEAATFGTPLHWEENRGTTPLVFLAAAIRKRPAQ